MTMFHTGIWIAENAPFIVLALYASFSRSYQKKTTSFTDDTVAFPVGTMAVWLCLICIPIFLSCAMMASAKLDFSSHHLDTVSKIMEVIIPAWVGLGLLFALPGTLIVSREGIEKRFWLRSNRKVLWGKIITITVGKDRVEIAGVNGKKIAHERFNLDRERFLFELKRRCSEEDFAERLEQNVAMAAQKNRGA